MATLEQSLKLHDKFSSVLTTIDKAMQNTLGTFEDFDEVMNRDVKMTGTEQIEQSLASTNEKIGKVVEGVEGLQSSMNKLVENSAQRPLIAAAPTVQQLNTIEQQSMHTQQSLEDTFIGLNDSISASTRKLELMREQYRNQAKEINMVRDQLNQLHESGAQDSAILKAEQNLNRLEQARLRQADAINRERDSLGELQIELEQVSSAIDNVDNNQMNGFSNAIQRSITWTQTLIDKVKQVAVVAPKEMAMSGFNSGIEKARQSLSNFWHEMQTMDDPTLGAMALQSLNRGIESATSRVDGLKERFSTVKNSIENSRVAQTRFGQALMSSDNAAKRLVSGLRTGLSNAGALTKSLAVNTAKLPFAWMKLIPILGRVIQRHREQRDLVDQTENSTNRLATAVKYVKFGVWVMALRKVYQMLNNVASKIDEITNTQTRLDVMLDITTSDMSLQELNDQIIASSINARAAWQDTANFVSKIGQQTDIFGDPSEAVAFSNLLQKSLRSSGASAEQMRSSMDQVALAMQRGKVEGRELRTLMEGAPLVVKSIADHFNMTTQELTEMAGEGVITAGAIKNAMFASADEIEERFAEIPVTWSDRWTQVKNVALYAFLPLQEAFNDFMNSDIAETLFNALASGFVFVASIATWAFEIIQLGLAWVAENIDRITLGLSILGAVLVTVAIVAAASWAIANWQFILMVGIIFWIIDVLHMMGLTADQVIGFMAGAVMWLGTVFYNVITLVIGAFFAFFQFVYNSFVGFYNNVLAVAEFFLNVWNHPIYSTQMLFYNMVKNILNFIASIVDGAGSAGDALGRAFINGVNIALRAVNKLADLLNKIPGINIGKVGEVGEGGGRGGSSAGNQIRGMAEKFNPGDAPSGYKSLSGHQLNMTPVDGLSNAINGLQSPMENYKKGYEWGSNLVNGVGDFMNNFEGMLGDQNKNMGNLVDQMGNIAKGADPTAGLNKGSGKGGAGSKLGKGKEVGDVGKIKSDVTISDEDLKYLKDIAESNFILRLQQVSPQATVHYTGSGNTEQDAKKMLELMEDMIVEQVATNLL